MILDRRLALLGLGAVALAPAVARAQALGAADRADVERFDAYLNALRTVRARFRQSAADGRVSQGTFYLARPGRLRLEYDPPVPILIIVNGGQLVHYDCHLGQPSFQSAASTPAGILVRDQIQLNGGGLQVVGVQRLQGQVRVTVVRTDAANEGRVTFAFAANPVALLDWQILDGQNRATRVQLSDVQTGVELARDLFIFRPEAVRC